MEFGVGHPDLALYRAIKAGESGLNLQLSDLLDREIELPSLFTVIKSLFTKERLKIRIRAYPKRLIDRLFTIQTEVDREVEKKIRQAESKGRM